MIGKTLGSYAIEEQLGAGGMAQVYRGRHIHLKRDVAIKVMHAHLSEQDDLRERFLREAQANAALKHPGIVQIYDFDVDEGVCYIAMELLDGRSLEERAYELGDAGRARFSVDEATRIVTEVGEALGYAHRHGVVHRDIKPSNVMITDEGRAVLTDFGLATILDQTRLTVDGTSAGTPSYMSPEQATGERGDHRADIYSLGVMSYQLFAGRLPFQSDTLVGMINKLLNEPAPSLRESVSDLPAHVVDAVDKALAKDPAQRFDSVDAMLAALRGDSPPAPVATTAPTATPAKGSIAKGSIATASAATTTAAATPTTHRGRTAWLGAAAIIALVAAAGWWSSGSSGLFSGAPQRPGDGDNDAVESMVPEVESMVPDGADAPSMAAIAGWVDGFDDNTHGWELSSGEISRALVGGAYEIDMRIGGQAVSAVAEKGGEFADLEYSVSGSLVDGQPESGYGLVFRRRDARNYYVFAINGLGQFSLWALQDGAWRELRGLDQTWTPAGEIDATGVNRLEVRAIGDSISASVNDTEVVVLRDATFSSGTVGFYAASSRTASAPRTRVRFDDVETKTLPAAGADAPSMVGR